jgi:acetyl/propionyl-CoA carboxylase alpha subunit
MKNIAQTVKGQLWVHFNGRTFVYESANQKKFGKKGAVKAKSGEILSPMPGKVTKLLKQVGSEVQAGDVVLVMEAMKMEYTLKADVSGKIETLVCQVGDQVALGKLLVKINESQG